MCFGAWSFFQRSKMWTDRRLGNHSPITVVSSDAVGSIQMLQRVPPQWVEVAMGPRATPGPVQPRAVPSHWWWWEETLRQHCKERLYHICNSKFESQQYCVPACRGSWWDFSFPSLPAPHLSVVLQLPAFAAQHCCSGLTAPAHPICCMAQSWSL